MTNYVDYEYYKNTYHGSLDATLFNSLIYEANLIVQNNVNRRLTTSLVTNQVKFVICKLVDHINSRNNREKEISSENIDGVSISYTTKGTEEYDSEMVNILGYLPQELIRYL